MGMSADNQDANAGPWNVALRKALVVDESSRGLQLYSTILETYGYWVRRCSSYHEGIRCLGEDVFDFVIVSQGTHHFEGSWVLVRALEMNPRLPVLVVARCLDLDFYEQAMRLGAMDYLVEPLTVWEVGRLVERHSQNRALPTDLPERTYYPGDLSHECV